MNDQAQFVAIVTAINLVATGACAGFLKLWDKWNESRAKARQEKKEDEGNIIQWQGEQIKRLEAHVLALQKDMDDVQKDNSDCQKESAVQRLHITYLTDRIRSTEAYAKRQHEALVKAGVPVPPDPPDFGSIPDLPPPKQRTVDAEFKAKTQAHNTATLTTIDAKLLPKQGDSHEGVSD